MQPEVQNKITTQSEIIFTGVIQKRHCPWNQLIGVMESVCCETTNNNADITVLVEIMKILAVSGVDHGLFPFRPGQFIG